MKKMLILLLVLGLVSVANATVTYEFRDAAGTTPVSGIDIGVGTATFVVMGQVADAGWAEGVYATDGTDGGGKFDVDGATAYPAAGDMYKANYYASFDGADCISGDLNAVVMPNPADGDWFVLDLSLNAGALVGDTVQIDILDMDGGYSLISSHSVLVTPEPMTIALLGLGGLFLRRRK